MLGQHRVGTLVIVDEGFGVGRVEPRLARDLDQHVGPADVAAPREVAEEQPVDDRGLAAGLGGAPDQAVGVHGRGRAPDRVEVEGDAFLQPGHGDAVVELTGALGVAELARQIGCAFHAVVGHVGVEHEGAPVNLGPLRLVDVFQGTLQPALADVAPGADRIGEDVEDHGAILTHRRSRCTRRASSAGMGYPRPR